MKLDCFVNGVYLKMNHFLLRNICRRARWLSGLKSKGCGFESHRGHCVFSLSKTLYPLLVQPRKTRPNMTEIVVCDVKIQIKQQKKEIFIFNDLLSNIYKKGIEYNQAFNVSKQSAEICMVWFCNT